MSVKVNPYTVEPLRAQREQLQGGYKIVFRIWEPGRHWCAYRGLTDWEDDRVAENGDEIPYEQAQSLFPGIAAAMGNELFYYN